jgi:hypothetical protein
MLKINLLLLGSKKFNLETRKSLYMKSDQRDYKRLRNKVSEEIEKAKKTFYAKKIRPPRSNDPKSWWSTIKKIGNSSKNQQIFFTNSENGESLTSSESAEEINNYLVNLTKDYVKITDDHLITGQSLTLPLVSKASVEKKLNQINVKKSTGPFDPPQKIIKRFSKELSFPVTDIINTSFREKRFGKIWKAYN